ncbi:maleylpyruvate isomerase family mycothiol-dependent enzyme [Okibacterium endophyticum]
MPAPGAKDDRSQRLADTLFAVADTLDTLTSQQWASPSLCEGWSVKDVVAHLTWRVGSSNRAFASSLVKASVAGRHLNPMRSMDDIARSLADARSPDELRRQIRFIATQKARGLGRTGTGELAEVVVHGYDAAQPCDKAILFAHETTERVARAGARIAPLRVRTVLANRQLVAADAGWSIGEGSEIIATAASIVLFIYGRRAIDPQRLRSGLDAPLPAPRPA